MAERILSVIYLRANAERLAEMERDAARLAAARVREVERDFEDRFNLVECCDLELGTRVRLVVEPSEAIDAALAGIGAEGR